MPAKEIVAGLSISQNSAALAILEHRADEIEILHLDSYMREEQNGVYWFATPLSEFLSKNRLNIHQVCVALDARELTLVNFPIDTSLLQSERNEHVHWELSHYIENFRPADYITDLHVFETNTVEQVQHVLAVAVQRTMVFGLQKHLRDMGLTLGAVDTNPFAAASALLQSHPEMRKGNCITVGVHEGRIDATVLRNGHTVAYRYADKSGPEKLAPFIMESFEKLSEAIVYMYGPSFTNEHLRSIRENTVLKVSTLDPFRRLLISPSLKGFDRFLRRAPEFVCPLGIALRKE